MMKKIITIIAISLFLVGCSGSDSEVVEQQEEKIILSTENDFFSYTNKTLRPFKKEEYRDYELYSSYEIPQEDCSYDDEYIFKDNSSYFRIVSGGDRNSLNGCNVVNVSNWHNGNYKENWRLGNSNGYNKEGIPTEAVLVVIDNNGGYESLWYSVEIENGNLILVDSGYYRPSDVYFQRKTHYVVK